MIDKKTCKIAHIPIIEEIAKGLKWAGMNEAYLELGIARARCFNRVSTYFTHSVAVDRSADSLKNITVQCDKNDMTTDDYFRQNYHERTKFNLIFIDARHRYENVKRDFDNSWEYLAKFGIILIHDTFAPSKEWEKHTLDCWKIQNHLDERKIKYITFPFYFGLTVVRK